MEREITREEYNKALDIVEAYRKQVPVQKKTLIVDWLPHIECSMRLYIALKSYLSYAEEKNREQSIYEIAPPIFVEDLTYYYLRRIRNFGKKLWEEFENLREDWLKKQKTWRKN